MKKLLYNLLAVILLCFYVVEARAVVSVSVNARVEESAYTSWGRFPGAKITNLATVAEEGTKIGDPLGNCNPKANPANDAAKTNNYEKSCVGQGITRDNFKVTVSFDPKVPAGLLPSTHSIPGPAVLPSGITRVWNSKKQEITVSSGCNDVDAGDGSIYVPKQFRCVAGQPVRLVSDSGKIYTAPVPLRVATTGYVQDAVPVAGSDPVSYNFSDMRYARVGSVNGEVIYNTRAVGSYAAGSISCVVGDRQAYAANVPVKSRDCEIIADVGKCKNLDPSFDIATDVCDQPSLGGAVIYGADGVMVTKLGNTINAVDGPNVNITSSLNLFNIVFQQISKQQVDATSLKNIELKLGHEKIPYPSLQARFLTKLEGKYACVYGYVSANKEWRVEGDYPQNLNQVYDEIDPGVTITATTQPLVPRTFDNNLQSHCVPIPPPSVKSASFQWSSLVSDVCTDSSKSSSQFRYSSATGQVRSFTGVIVECIEDTMMNLFYPAATNKDGVTFFSALQERLKDAIRLLMVLYLIFFGYKLMIGKEAPKRHEWTWLMLKLALVAYFAVGSGMLEALQVFRGITNGTSTIIMEAGLQAADSNKDGLVYSYCNFQDKSKFTYPEGKEHMAMWDMVDCKISKYLGIGDSSQYHDAPMVILVALLSPISVAMGIPIFFISILVLIVLLSLIIRIVHIYVMAFMAIMMLVYLAPIVIPSVFFEGTKGIFSKWLEQIIGFVIQPIILFGFLSFMFIIIDGVMFGGNHQFDKNQYIPMQLENSAGKITYKNKLCNDGVCTDTSALGYIYQVAEIKRNSWPGGALSFFNIWRIDLAGQDMALFIGLSKLLLISFVIYALTGIVENLSGRMVALYNAADSMSGAKPISPVQAMEGIARGVSGAKDAAVNTAQNAPKIARGVAAVITAGATEVVASKYKKHQANKKAAAAEKDKNRDMARAAEKAAKANEVAKAAKEKAAQAAQDQAQNAKQEDKPTPSAPPREQPEAKNDGQENKDNNG